MAEKDIRVDLNLHGNEVRNFAVHNVDPSSVEHPVDGQLVYHDGKLYLWDESIEPNGAWVEQGDAADIRALEQSLSNEVTRATNAETAIAGDLADEVTRATNAETAIAGDLADEVTRATGAEQAIASDLSDEVTRATTAEGVLQGNIDAEEAARIAADNTKVDKEIQGTNGKAIIFNEADGGGAKFEHNDGTESFVGVNDGGENGLVAQIYADKLVGGKWTGAKLDVTQGGMYYTVGDKSFAQRAVAENEIAVKGDVTAEETRAKAAEAELARQISEKDSLPERSSQTAGMFLTNDGTDAAWAALPEYTIAKDSQAEAGYAHTYHLQKDGVNVGASINIPKDMVVESGTVETCTQDDVPVQGYKVGDKYIDLVLANSGQSHLYILVTDLIDVYTGSTYIEISGNVVSLKYSTLETKLQDTFYTESEVDAIANTKVDKELTSANGKALIFNETDGGGAKFEHSDGTWSFVGVNDGGASGIDAQIYAVTPVSGGTADGARIDVTKDGMYYTVGNQSASQRMTSSNEIATKGDIASAISAKKQVVSCPAIAAVGSQFTWSITNEVGADAIVNIYESGVEVVADVTVTASTITIKMNQTEDLQSITAGQFKAVILG